MASSSSGSVYHGQIDRYVDHLPKPIRTGRSVEDEQFDATHRVLQNMLRDVLKDRSHIMPLWTCLDDRKRKFAVEQALAFSADTFETATSLSALKEKEFLVSWLAGVSDFQPNVIVDITTKNP